MNLKKIIIYAGVLLAGIYFLNNIYDFVFNTKETSMSSESINNGKNHKIDYSNIYFADISVPFEGEYKKNKFKFEKEYLLTKYQEYQVILYIERARQKFPNIDQKLKSANLPLDLKYVAVAESALRSNVTSSAGAAGIWQFMPATAREYGLRVDSLIDERLHDDKSTDSAILYFNKLYKKFSDWPLALASYNRGENAIDKALTNQNVDSYYDLYLNSETSRYVFRVLAIKYVLENIDSIYSKDFVSVISPLETKEILVEGDRSLMEIAEEYGTVYQNIKDLNPWILTEYLPEGIWKIKILN